MADIFLRKALVFGNREKDLVSRVLRELSLKISKGVFLEKISQNTNVKKEKVGKLLKVFEFLGFVKKMDNFLENSKEVKYYFHDLGIRNFLIKNFKGFDKRRDFYELFENYMIVERENKLKEENKKTEMFFWKTEKNKEIPLVEKNGDSVQAFEFEKEVFKSLLNLVFSFV